MSQNAVKKSVVISQLFVYPVKSLPGVAQSSIMLDRLGAVDDRRYMLVDASGKFISQRQDACLANIRLAPHSDGWQLMLPSADSGASRLLPRTGRMDSPVTVTVWKDTCHAFDQGDEWAEWFGNYLGKPVRLVYTPVELKRRIDIAYCADERHVSFTDGYPLLVTAESSRLALESCLDLSLDMHRFRPNIVVTGSTAFAEDNWRALRFGDNELALVKPCSRCVVPTINPDTAEKQKQVWEVMERLRKAADGKIYFGQNAIHQQPGQLTVGDRLEVVERD